MDEIYERLFKRCNILLMENNILKISNELKTNALKVAIEIFNKLSERVIMISSSEGISDKVLKENMKE